MAAVIPQAYTMTAQTMTMTAQIIQWRPSARRYTAIIQSSSASCKN